MLNRAEIIGRVGKSEVRYMPNGDPVANFTVAATEKWNDKQSGQPREKTEWFNCVAYNPLADIIGRYVDVGDLLYIDGKIQTRKYQDKNGNDRYITEIHVRELKMLTTKAEKEARNRGHDDHSSRGGQGHQQTQQNNAPQYNPPAQDDFDNVPF
ncbi:single-stranded DNA-binding protein [uncultured Cardiobacterium sp.]|uniref:single-stranded DNA-binding protein n=1 Tax=uncultured Cardiobacterium sp. TaxID=417619 RepID=UPI00260515F3|nr:single-stranded DNA-binding protein [uncultured Cardiobacterium sp.]